MDAYARYTGESNHFKQYLNKNPAFGKTGSTLLLSGASIVGENGQISVQKMNKQLEECPTVSNLEERFSLKKYSNLQPDRQTKPQTRQLGRTHNLDKNALSRCIESHLQPSTGAEAKKNGRDEEAMNFRLY